jgi:hypothetical protein
LEYLHVNYRFLALLLLLACITFPSAHAAEPKKPIPEMMELTYKLANPESTGTCFLISRPTAVEGQTETILVTAAHVFEKMSGHEAVLVLHEKRSDGAWVRKETSIKIREKDAPLWVKHPEADVAAMKLHLPADASFSALPADRIAGEADFQSGKLRTGDEVWIFCYPAKLEANAAGFAVLRRGTVASYPLVPVASYKDYLVDTTSFGGGSGAPVMVALRENIAQKKSAKRPWIVGLVSGMQRETEKAALDLADLTFHHPLGLSIVVPGEFIRQTLDRVPRDDKKAAEKKSGGP